MDAILLMIKEAVTSKKFVTTIAATIAAAAMKIGLDLPTESVAVILSPVITYIIGQGWADTGKEAAKVTATAHLAAERVTPSQAVKDKLL